MHISIRMNYSTGMSLLFGTCSWKYSSWIGLVYSSEQRYAAEYLPEYARHFGTAEIDSWFYHMPSSKEAEDYAANVPEGFRFTCKVPRDLTLTHTKESGRLIPNENFLSPGLFEDFLEATRSLHANLDAVMFQFEYLNRKKISGPAEFIDKFGLFVKDIAPDIPVALEIRNPNFLSSDYFHFLEAAGIIPVLVEKQYMPPVTSVYRDFGHLIGRRAVVRLMGGDRKEIETLSGHKWDRLWLPKDQLPEITAMLQDLGLHRQVTVNVNNHFEGSSPLTIQRLKELL